MMTANGLAKLLEELGELAQVAAKRLAYFHTSEHPDGAGDLNERMQAEMGDVLAAIRFVREQFGLSLDAIADRSLQKYELFQKWHADQTNGGDCFHATPAAPSGVASHSDSRAAFIDECMRKGATPENAAIVADAIASHSDTDQPSEDKP